MNRGGDSLVHRALTSRAHCSGGVRGRPLVGIAPKASRADCQVAPRWINPRPACRTQLSFQLADSFESALQTAVRLLEHPVILRAALAVHRRGFLQPLNPVIRTLTAGDLTAENSSVYEEMLDGCPGIGAGRSIVLDGMGR